MKILIGLPVYKTISVKTAFSLVEMLKNIPEGTLVQVIFQEGVFVHQNQNDIAEYAVKNNFDAVLFVEHDMVFEPDTLSLLLRDDKDIVGANYNFKSEPLQSMVFDLEGNPLKEVPKETFQASAIPTGLMLVKTSVFQKLPKPYFFYEYEQGTMKTSQDIYFCQKARQNGLEVWCNPNITVKHLGEKLY